MPTTKCINKSGVEFCEVPANASLVDSSADIRPGRAAT